MGRKKDIKYDQAYLLYLNGLSLREVAKELSVSRQTVYYAFKKRNFKLRNLELDSSDFKIKALYDWVNDANRQPAITIFTDGYYREIALLFESMIKNK